MTLAVLACFAAGLSVSWWLNRPDPPWLVFTDISATYEPGSTVIKVTGTYTATRTCPPTENPNQADPLEWEQRVKGTKRAPVAIYAPQPEAPKLEKGTHRFAQEIPLEKGILPDGWHVSVLVTCAKEPFAIRSKSVPVEFVEPTKEEVPD